MTIVMMLVGVQGYAQPRYHRPAPRPHVEYFPRGVPHYYHRPYYRPLPSYYYWHPMGYWYYTPLSVYWWGDSWDSPTKIQIECLEFKKTSSGRLRVKNGKEPKFYLSTYEESHFSYRTPSGNIVEVRTGDGKARIDVRDANGKHSATYTL